MQAGVLEGADPSDAPPTPSVEDVIGPTTASRKDQQAGR